MTSDLKFLVPLSLGVIILNALAIFVVVKTRTERRKSTTWILVSLLASDILVGGVVIPTRIINILLLQSAVFPYIYAYILFVAVFNVTFLTWDRYSSIQKPMWRRQFGNRKMISILALSWIVPAIMSLLPLAWASFSKYITLLSTIYRYFLVAVLLGVLIVVVVLQALLLRGVYKFWRGELKEKGDVFVRGTRHGNSNSLRRKVKSTSLMIGVTLSMLATWLPTIILNFQPELMLTWVAKWSLYSFFVNSLVDPILVLLFNYKFFSKKRQTCLNRSGDRSNRSTQSGSRSTQCSSGRLKCPKESHSGQKSSATELKRLSPTKSSRIAQEATASRD